MVDTQTAKPKPKVKVEISPDSGFCFGVVYAIGLAEEWLEKDGELYCLGDLVHNDMEIQRLKNKGLKIISREDLKKIKNAKVLIRAHGEPTETYSIALKNNIQLIDASCPIVLKIQNRIREAVNEAPPQSQIVIFGKRDHPEVIGLSSQVPQHMACIIIQSEKELSKIDFSKPIYLFSQTTKDLHKYYAIAEKVKQIALQHGNKHVRIYDTICRQVANRESKLREFARNYDVIIFVAGKKSSNGRVLFELCKSVNPNTYFVSTPQEVKKEWIQNATKIGICGATSTPWWLMEYVKKQVLNMLSE